MRSSKPKNYFYSPISNSKTGILSMNTPNRCAEYLKAKNDALKQHEKFLAERE